MIHTCDVQLKRGSQLRLGSNRDNKSLSNKNHRSESVAWLYMCTLEM